MAEVISNMGEHNRKFEKAVEKALRLVGGQAERAAKEMISEMGAVDTGLLRNSITFALDGEAPNATEYQDDHGKQTGEYDGEVPSDHGHGTRTVYIGTNVYYAPYVEYGTRKMVARPFLSTSIQANIKEMQDLFKEAFDVFND